MTEEEVKQAFDEMKAQGATDDDILASLYLMYQDEKLSTDQLAEMVDILGYEFSPEFAAMSEEDKHSKGYEEEEGAAEGVSQEQVEDAKETGDNEPKNDNEGGNDQGGNSEDKPQPPKADDNAQDDKPQDDKPQGEDNKSDAGDNEDDERKQAMKLFGFNK